MAAVAGRFCRPRAPGTGGGSSSPTVSEERAGRSGEASASRSPSPSPSASPADEAYTVAEDRAPRTRSAAAAFIRELAVRPDLFFEANDDGGAFLYRVTGGSARFAARWDDIGEEAGGET
ncbi:hypothetical protein [Streptomyces sp. NPDC055185]